MLTLSYLGTMCIVKSAIEIDLIEPHAAGVTQSLAPPLTLIAHCCQHDPADGPRTKIDYI